MADYTLFTYGAGEVLETTFNAIATVINGKTGTLYQPLIRFALMLGFLWATATLIYGDRTRFFVNWAVPFYLALTLFFAPTCTIKIHDRATSGVHTVDNVPLGLGASAGVISQISDVVTREIEKLFSLPDDLKYHKTGTVMASNLIAKARTFRITNPELQDSMKCFINQCVVYEALLGTKYTFEDLKNSKDIWGLVAANPSQARAFSFKAPGKGEKAQILTCAQGVKALEPYMQKQVETAFQVFEGKIFGKKSSTSNTPLGAQLKQYLPGAFDYMGNMSKSASEYMMQQIMIHTVMDSIESKSTELGNAHNFAIQRAYLQQRANQQTVAGIAAQKVVAMKNVMEALVYAAFIFILPLALLPLGWRFISQWFGLLMWVQLWSPLYAVLNFIVNLSVRNRGVGMITDSEGAGITIANSVGFMDLHADMAAQAGFMSIAVGSLAYALVKGGASAVSHLTSQESSPALSSAASATESLVSGNYSFGNLSQGTVAAYNTSLGHWNDSPSYGSGAFTQNDGVISRSTSADGSHVISVANSQLREQLNVTESDSQSYQEQADQRFQFAKSEMVTSGRALSDTYRQTAELADRQAKSASSGDSYTSGENVNQSNSFTKLDGLVDKFAEDRKIEKSDAARILANVSASASTGVGFKLLGNGATVSVEGKLSAQKDYAKTDSDTWSAAKDFSKQYNLQDAFNKAQQASQDIRYSETDEKSKSLAKSISASYESSRQHRDEANKAFQQSQTFSRTASYLKTNSGQINQGLGQEFIDWLPKQALPNSRGSMGLKEAETIIASRPELNHQYQQLFMQKKMTQIEALASQSNLPSSAEAVYSAYRSHSIDSNVSKSGLTSVTSQANNQGLEDAFRLNQTAKTDVKQQLERVQDQIAEQTEMLAKEAKIREAGFGK